MRPAVREGQSFLDRQDRTGFRFTFDYGDDWNGTHYDDKELTVWKLDRLGRSMKDLIEQVERVEELGAQFVSALVAGLVRWKRRIFRCFAG